MKNKSNLYSSIYSEIFRLEWSVYRQVKHCALFAPGQKPTRSAINRAKIIVLCSLLILSACQKETTIIGETVSDMLWLEHKGAQMPILVEGNTASKTFILLLHGGPGGTSTVYNTTNLAMSDPLETRYAIAYWDQRLSGNAKGNFDKEDITAALMIEDTDKVIDLLKHRYGQDISIFLLGHSWGGYLGNAYLAHSESNQAKIKGWIDVDGAHNIEMITTEGLALMKEVGQRQIAVQSDKQDTWTDIISFVEEVKPNTSIDADFTFKVNRKAHQSLFVAGTDNLINVFVPEQEELSSTLFKDNHFLSSFVSMVQMLQTDLWEEILEAPLSEELSKIKTPSLLLWGKYDFVVPPSLGYEALENLGTPSEDKSLHIFEKSGHSPTHEEPEKVVALVVDFIETYK